jgi:hypothetical protein
MYKGKSKCVKCNAVTDVQIYKTQYLLIQSQYTFTMYSENFLQIIKHSSCPNTPVCTPRSTHGFA